MSRHYTCYNFGKSRKFWVLIMRSRNIVRDNAYNEWITMRKDIYGNNRRVTISLPDGYGKINIRFHL